MNEAAIRDALQIAKSTVKKRKRKHFDEGGESGESKDSSWSRDYNSSVGQSDNTEKSAPEQQQSESEQAPQDSLEATLRDFNPNQPEAVNTQPVQEVDPVQDAVVKAALNIADDQTKEEPLDRRVDQVTDVSNKFGFGTGFNAGTTADLGLTPVQPPRDIQEYTQQRLDQPYEGTVLNAAMYPGDAFGMSYPSLVGMELPRDAAAGILGNFLVESPGLEPTYITPGGVGLAQWTGPRKASMLNSILGQNAQQTFKKEGAASLQGTMPQQLGFALNEIASNPDYSSVSKTLQNPNVTSLQASNKVYTGYEKPPSDISEARRASLANQIAIGVPTIETSRVYQPLMDTTMNIPKFARGGAISHDDIAHALRIAQSLGRNGDTILAHINPNEAKLLKKHGGSGKRNPYTGLYEFDESGGGGGEGGGGGGGEGGGGEGGGDHESETRQADNERESQDAKEQAQSDAEQAQADKPAENAQPAAATPPDDSAKFQVPGNDPLTDTLTGFKPDETTPPQGSGMTDADYEKLKQDLLSSQLNKGAVASGDPDPIAAAVKTAQDTITPDASTTSQSDTGMPSTPDSVVRAYRDAIIPRLDDNSVPMPTPRPSDLNPTDAAVRAARDAITQKMDGGDGSTTPSGTGKAPVSTGPTDPELRRLLGLDPLDKPAFTDPFRNLPVESTEDPTMIAKYNTDVGNVMANTPGFDPTLVKNQLNAPRSATADMALGQRTPLVVDANGNPTLGSSIGGLFEDVGNAIFNPFIPMYLPDGSINPAYVALNKRTSGTSSPSTGPDFSRSGKNIVPPTTNLTTQPISALPSTPHVAPTLPGIAAPYVPPGAAPRTPSASGAGYKDLGASASVQRQAQLNQAIMNALRLTGPNTNPYV